jgi:hypothetical protein
VLREAFDPIDVQKATQALVVLQQEKAFRTHVHLDLLLGVLSTIRDFQNSFKKQVSCG